MTAVAGRARAVVLALLAALAVVTGCQGAPPAAPASSPPPPWPTSADVVVVGAGTGGVGAAIQAARLGSSVVLLEQTPQLGGQALSVGAMDEGSTAIRREGLYAEYAARVEGYYAARHVAWSTCHYRSWSLCVQPSVTDRVLAEMLAEAKVDVRREVTVTAVDRRGDVVTGVQTTSGPIRARVVIDATEYGDLLPLARVPYRVGNGTGAAPSGCVQSITWTATMRRYAKGTMPADLSMIGKPPPPHYDRYAPAFRAQVRRSGNPNYPRPPSLPMGVDAFLAYRGLPDPGADVPASQTPTRQQISRTQLNRGNDQRATAQTVVDPVARRMTECQAKLRTLALLYYVQVELGRSDWAIATDEGVDERWNAAHVHCPAVPPVYAAIERAMPSRPYVRESRRMVGRWTLTGAQIHRQGSPAHAPVTFPTSIATGYYPVDLHGCRLPRSLERGETPTDRPPGLRAGPFEVPLGVLLPRKVNGFLAAEKNISQTRLANGATRLQPETMLVGQAAGALAGIAVARRVTPRAVVPLDVQDALVGAGSFLTEQHWLDVPRNTGYARSVELAQVHGLLTSPSQTRYAPDGPAPRAVAAAGLARALGLAADAGPTGFVDVPRGRSYAGAVAALRRHGIPLRCQASRFCPAAPVTRGELARWVAAALADGGRVPAAPSLPTLTDVVTGGPTAAAAYVVRDAHLMPACARSRWCPHAVAPRRVVAQALVGVLRDRLLGVPVSRWPVEPVPVQLREVPTAR